MMKVDRAVIALLILIVLAICTSSIPKSSTIQSRAPVISSSQSTSTNLLVPKPELVCLSLSVHEDEWPVSSSLEEWNRNENGFKFSLQGECAITFTLWSNYESSEWWGRTELDLKRITLNPNTPVGVRQHVVCHELGHVMGLPHTDDLNSCMNIGLTITHPSPTDLQEAGKNTWLLSE